MMKFFFIIIGYCMDFFCVKKNKILFNVFGFLLILNSYYLKINQNKMFIRNLSMLLILLESPS
jgi:hypothetical protein